MARNHKLITAVNLARNYGFNRLTGKPSTAGFWWRKEIARTDSPAALKRYLASADPSPFYVMDYSSKLTFNHTNDQGIMVLPYGQPIGDQINPEAAFILAMALHDDFVINGKAKRRKEFLEYARFFLERQQPDGSWHYTFDWPGSKAPWTSALAQGRGASVMLRAALLTTDQAYSQAAILALSKFDKPLAQDGFRAIHHLSGTPYYEEYPARPIGVINGFMASLLGCWEVGHWLDDSHARHLFDQGIESLVEMTPHYMTEWWSVYDRNPDVKSPNLNTPRYHKLVASYLDILAELSNHNDIADLRDQWRSRLGLVNEIRALSGKFIWKLEHGVFSS